MADHLLPLEQANGANLSLLIAVEKSSRPRSCWTIGLERKPSQLSHKSKIMTSINSRRPHTGIRRHIDVTEIGSDDQTANGSHNTTIVLHTMQKEPRHLEHTTGICARKPVTLLQTRRLRWEGSRKYYSPVIRHHHHQQSTTKCI